MRTKEQLEAYLKAFKEKKQRQKERERASKEKAVKEKQSKQKRVEKLKKELYVQQLINTHIKPFEKPPKPVKHIPLINVGIGDFDEEKLYTTREALIEAEKRGEGKLNWEKFDQLVSEIRSNYAL